MTASPDFIDRLDELEMRIAHQDSAIEELSELSIRQWKEIEALNEKLGYMKGKLQAVEDGLEGAPPGDVPPPHY